MNKIGRPKGFKVSEESKKKASNTMKNYYENMTPKQRQIRDNYNKMKSPDSRQLGCTEDKVKAIEAALKYFHMIKNKPGIINP